MRAGSAALVGLCLSLAARPAASLSSSSSRRRAPPRPPRTGAGDRGGGGGGYISRSSFLSGSAACLLAAAAAAGPAPSHAAPPGAPAPPSSTSSSSTSSSTSSTSSLSARRRAEAVEESISGAISGAALTVTKTAVKYPLDTATVRLQMPGTAYSIADLGGLFGDCFRGISAPLLGNIPAGAVFFAVKDAARAGLRDQDLPRWATTSLAVLAAQGPYWLIRNPSEVIKTRQQAGVEGYGGGTSALDAVRLVVGGSDGGGGGSGSGSRSGSGSGSGGLGGLYSGYLENIAYAYPADVIKFVCYDSLSGGRKDLPPALAAGYGAISTAAAQLVTTPLDVVRNRIMAGQGDGDGDGDGDGGDQSPAGASGPSYFGRLARIARDEGAAGLFAGARPRVGKAVLSGAIQFATYEETKQSMGRFLERRSNA